jgi:hypothetical protein
MGNSKLKGVTYMRSTDILKFEIYDNGEIRVYIEDKVGHHAFAIVHKEKLLSNLFPVLETCYGKAKDKKEEIKKQGNGGGYTRLLKEVVF